MTLVTLTQDKTFREAVIKVDKFICIRKLES